MKRTVRLLLALLLLPALSGCLDLREELWVNGDGSGRMLLKMRLSEMIVLMAQQENPKSSPFGDLQQLRASIEQHPGVEKVYLQESSDSGFRQLTVDVTVENYRTLEKLHQSLASRGDPQTNLDTLFTFTDSGEDITFMQTFRGSREMLDIPQGSGEVTGEPMTDMSNNLARNMLDALYGDHNIEVTLHAPKVLQGNGEISNNQQTIYWRIPLAKLANGEQSGEIQAVINDSVPMIDQLQNWFEALF